MATAITNLGAISSSYAQTWQANCEHLSTCFKHATVLLLSLQKSRLQTLCSNTGTSREEQYWPLEQFPRLAESVTSQELIVQNVSGTPLNTPLGEYRCYVLLPIIDPDNNSFGLLCLFDNKQIPFGDNNFNFLYQNKQLIERDLCIIHLNIYLQDMQQGKTLMQRTLNRNSVDLQQLKNDKDSFLNTICHEIRTAVNGILGPAQLMQTGDFNHPDSGHLNTITQSGNDIIQLLEKHTSYKKGPVKHNSDKLKLEAFDLKRLVERAINKYQAVCERKQLQLNVLPSQAKQHKFIGDPNKIYSILSSFIENAITHTQVGVITVKIAINKNHQTVNKYHVIFSVSDTGKGVSDSQKQILLGSKVALKHKALKIWRCRQYLDLMAGKMGVDSLENMGSVFWASVPLTLPLGNLDANSNDLDSRKLPPLKILVAEDNPINIMVVKGMLERLGQKPVFVSDGKQALDTFIDRSQHDAIELIIMDCEMPIMDGYKAATEIRKYEQSNELAKTPIVALSAHAMDDCVERCYQAGMNNHLAKPVRIEALRSILLSYTRESQWRDEISGPEEVS